MKKRRVKTILVIALWAGVLKSQESLTYNNYLRHIMDHNVISEKAANNNRIAEMQYRSALGNYDPQFSAAIDNKFFTGKNYFTTSVAEIKQPIFASNYLKAGYAYGQGTNVNPENYTPANGQLYLGLETSVLQGLLFDKRRAEILKAKHYTDYYNSEQKIQLNDLLFQSANTYVNLLYVNHQNRLYTYFMQLASQRSKGIQDLVAIGERAPVDTIEASIFLLSRLLEKQASETDIQKEYNNLLVIYRGNSQEISRALLLSDSLDAIFDGVVRRSIIETEKTSSNPLVDQYIAKQGVLETEQRFRKELIKPALNLNYNLLGTGNPDYFSGLSPNNYKWGVTFSLPLLLRKQRYDYKLATIQTRNNTLELTNKQNEITYKQKYLNDNLRITQQQIENAKRASAYSKALVEAERLKFQNGESSLFILNARESKWLESELKLLDCKLKFIKLVFELIYLNGNLEYQLIL